MRRRFPVVLGGFLLGAGCSALAPDPASRVLQGGKGSISVRELEQRTKNFADRYVQLLADAVEDVKERTDSLRERKAAHLLKLQSATSAWDVVTSSHPLQEMLDLLVQTELQVAIWAEEGLAGRVLGPERGGRVVDALRSAHREILSLARRAMPESQIGDIQRLIRDWRRRNPSLESGAFVRFGPYLEAPGGTLVTQVLSGFGILDLSRLNPLDPAAQQVERVVDTTDDALYMAKRMPMLLQWQAEAATYDILLAADTAVEGAPEVLEGGRTLLQETSNAARALEGTFRALEKVTNPEKDPEEEEGPPGRPFDIREYTAAAAQAARSAREARALLEEARSFAGSPALASRIRQAGGQAERLLAQMLVSAILLLLVFFVLLLAFRALSLRLQERREPAPPPGGS